MTDGFVAVLRYQHPRTPGWANAPFAWLSFALANDFKSEKHGSSSGKVVRIDSNHPKVLSG